MAELELNIRFHNPNAEAETTDYIARVFIEVGKRRCEKLLEAITFSEGLRENECGRVLQGFDR